MGGRGRWRVWAVVGVALLCLAPTIAAQSWRGMGRVAGKVTDEAGAPIDGALVKAFLPAANGGTEARTNKKGEWAIGAISRGEWQLDVSKDGYKSRQIAVSVAEMSRLPPMTIVLEKAVPVVDHNAELRGRLEQAASLMNQRQYAAARTIYEGLLATYPQAYQILPLIARTYYAENQLDKSAELLKQAIEKDTDNVEMKLLLGNVLVEKGDVEAGRELLNSIDESRVKDPTIFLNVGIGLLNKSRPADALVYFEKDIRLFPNAPDAYYYRGITFVQNGKIAEARADLEKFVAMAPEAPEAATARKILEQLK